MLPIVELPGKRADVAALCCWIALQHDQSSELLSPPPLAPRNHRFLGLSSRPSTIKRGKFSRARELLPTRYGVRQLRCATRTSQQLVACVAAAPFHIRPPQNTPRPPRTHFSRLSPACSVFATPHQASVKLFLACHGFSLGLDVFLSIRSAAIGELQPTRPSTRTSTHLPHIVSASPQRINKGLELFTSLHRPQLHHRIEGARPSKAAGHSFHGLQLLQNLEVGYPASPRV